MISTLQATYDLREEQALQRPRVNRPQEPKLLEMPKTITKKSLVLAHTILGRGMPTHMGAFHHNATQIKQAEREYVWLAVLKQWLTFDPERFLKETKATLIQCSRRGNELYLVQHLLNDSHFNIYGVPQRHLFEEHYLKYVCPSTGKVYVSPVPNHCRTADGAMAWKFRLTAEEYKQLTIET